MHEPEVVRTTSSRSPKRGSGIKTVIASIAVVVLCGGAYYYFYVRNDAETDVGVSAKQNAAPIGETAAANAATAQPVTTEDMVAKVGKLILLPSGETPTLATVSDLSKLKDQPFFANAKQGDIVLLYATARKAYLYDPIQNMLIEVAPISDTPDQHQ